jgi:hypothetical protein
VKRLKTCSVEGCGRFIGRDGGRGYCHYHYQRWRLYGNPTEPSRRNTPPIPTPHDQIPTPWQHATREDNERFRQLADHLVDLNMKAAARYRMQNARDDAAEHQVAAA